MAKIVRSVACAALCLSLLCVATASAQNAGAHIPPFLVGAWIGSMTCQSAPDPALVGKYGVVTTYQANGEILNIMQKKGAEQWLSPSSITSMECQGQNCTMLELQELPPQRGPNVNSDTGDVCEKYFFKTSKKGKLTAFYYGSWGPCPASVEAANWYGHIRKINLSSPSSMLELIREM
mmetsp:Transcript_28755/g.80975  ORF Transcript_28755/g.80975 Transcript_28755/m.80975 type:complete len:178 (-) Transcript_28755:117-650(-)